MDDDHLNNKNKYINRYSKDDLPRPITKPAVQYAAQDFRNLLRTLFGTVNSVVSPVVPVAVARRGNFPIGILKSKK
jgi:hypothetical protein